jgi:Cu(I)/Ag(I) efflux system membrane fusion protein/cobalt-zinc-cadmium efflux system membrane fusion protein
MPGEQIVTSAQFLFDSESRLQEAIQKMLQQKDGIGTDPEMEEMDMPTEEMNHETETETMDHSEMDM